MKSYINITDYFLMKPNIYKIIQIPYFNVLVFYKVICSICWWVDCLVTFSIKFLYFVDIIFNGINIFIWYEIFWYKWTRLRRKLSRGDILSWFHLKVIGSYDITFFFFYKTKTKFKSLKRNFIKKVINYKKNTKNY